MLTLDDVDAALAEIFDDEEREIWWRTPHPMFGETPRQIWFDGSPEQRTRFLYMVQEMGAHVPGLPIRPSRYVTVGPV